MPEGNFNFYKKVFLLRKQFSLNKTVDKRVITQEWWYSLKKKDLCFFTLSTGYDFLSIFFLNKSIGWIQSNAICKKRTSNTVPFPHTKKIFASELGPCLGYVNYYSFSPLHSIIPRTFQPDLVTPSFLSHIDGTNGALIGLWNDSISIFLTWDYNYFSS